MVSGDLILLTLNLHLVAEKWLSVILYSFLVIEAVTKIVFVVLGVLAAKGM